jgi:glycosyltransferase involved in cell wall biosynthesis
LKLIIFIYSLGCGGAERVAVSLANYWAGSGWKITVVTLASRSLDFYELHPAIERVSLNNAEDSRNMMVGAWRNLCRIIALRRALREVRPDLALGMMTDANVLLAIAIWGTSIRAIGSERIHPPQYPLSLLWEGLRRRAYGWLHTVVALTSESAIWLKDHTNVRRVVVIPNAAPWPLLVQEDKIIPESVCCVGRKILLAVGRLESQKGFDQLLDAFSILAQKHSDWDLVVLGEGALRTAIEHQVQTERLEKRVFLPGRVGNVGKWYEHADLYVMSSRFEGFPNTLAEALAYGLPAVSFDCDTGPRDIIRHEVDGLLVTQGDVAGLSTALDRLMGDVDLRERFGKRAVEARERLSLERITGMWEELFDEVTK